MTGAAALVLAAALGPKPPTHKIAVEVRGPLAIVEVTRTLTGDGGEGAERLLDVALPEGAALVRVDIHTGDGGKWRAVDVAPADKAPGTYVDALEKRGLTPTREPFDDSTTYRVRVARTAESGRGPLELRYRFALVPSISDGRCRIRFPGSPERMPVPAEVSIAAAGSGDVEIAGVRTPLRPGHATATGRVSTRAGWEISWATRAPAAGRATAGPPLGGSLALAKVSPAETIVAVAVDARGRAEVPPPPNVLLMIDRSRSVGLPGLSAERDLARRLLEALPPATRFDALFFDRATTRLHPMSRPATREAIGALDAEMVPDRLRNGTDLPAALHDAGALLAREASAFGPRTLLAIITDGALPETTDGPALARALGAPAGVALSIAVWVVRSKSDDPAPAAATRALRDLAARHDGILRELRANDVGETLAPALSALARGGDVAEIRLAAGGAQRQLADGLAPGEGHAGVLTLAQVGREGVEVTGTAHGARVRAALRPQAVDPELLRALAGPPRAPRLLAADDVVALVEAGPRHVEPVVARGFGTDRTVVRNTLSLAYMPRARACYLTRTAATPALRDLEGRVRLAIELSRGEVSDAVVQSSTLHHPGIEACLRDGAFAIEVPRSASDATVTAVLNLVFRPRTPEKKAAGAGDDLGAQIDLVIEELHRSQAQPEPEPPAPDRSMIPTR